MTPETHPIDPQPIGYGLGFYGVLKRAARPGRLRPSARGTVAPFRQQKRGR